MGMKQPAAAWLNSSGYDLAEIIAVHDWKSMSISGHHTHLKNQRGFLEENKDRVNTAGATPVAGACT